jgi:hydrogenase maturation factor
VGKVPKDILKNVVLNYLGASSESILQGPKIGEDAAIISVEDKVLVFKSNPITGAEQRIGWLAVHINANDIAVCGATPRWFMNTVLLPVGSTQNQLDTIMAEMHEACLELGISIIGGHTEVAPGLSKPIVAGFMVGEVPKQDFIISGGAITGDKIVLTKGTGIEGTGILASDFKDRLTPFLREDTLMNAEKMLDMISVVPEALAASKVKGVHSIHTPTEGGVLNGLLEISEASGLGFKVYESNFLIKKETIEISKILNVNPLKLLSSGSLLIVVDSEEVSTLIDVLNKCGVESSVIGDIQSDNRQILVKTDGVEVDVDNVEQDELFRLLESM